MDANGDPVAGALVRFSIDSREKVTDADGSVSAVFTATEAGTFSVTATVVEVRGGLDTTVDTAVSGSVTITVAAPEPVTPDPVTPDPVTPDAGDAGASDAGASDAGASDAGASDAGASDAGASDAGASDAGASDAVTLNPSFTVWTGSSTTAAQAFAGLDVSIWRWSGTAWEIYSTALPESLRVNYALEPNDVLFNAGAAVTVQA